MIEKCPLCEGWKEIFIKYAKVTQPGAGALFPGRYIDRRISCPECNGKGTVEEGDEG